MFAFLFSTSRNLINFSKLINNLSKIKMNVGKIIATNKSAKEMLNSLTFEASALRSQLVSRKKQKLIEENLELLKQIESAKLQLIMLETKNGKKQISLPNVKNLCSTIETNESEMQMSKPQKQIATPKEGSDQTQKPTKEKKPKKDKPPTTDKVTTEAPVDVGRLDLRVGKIIEVSCHPDANTLYLEKIDCGEPNPRTVVSGLVNFVPIEEMQDRMVIVLCNLKPAKMRGIISEAMVMCASSPEKVEVLSPPNGSQPGDLVYCDGYERSPDAQLNPKKKIFETCAPDLKTNDELVACFKGKPLKTDNGNILAQTLKNVQVK